MAVTSGSALIDLSSAEIRHGFVKKVYGILGAQMVLTTVLGGLVMRFGLPLAKSQPSLVMGVLFTSMAVSVMMTCVFTCCPHTMREFPINYVLLGLFTIAESVMVGFICIQYTQESVLIALGLTAFIVLGLTLFACQSKVDFTGMAPYLFSAVMVLLGFSFLLWMASLFGLSGTPAFKTLRLVYSALGALVFSMYIVFDTQMIMGGKHKLQFGIDDYVMAAISLYIDIVQLFLFLLQLFGERRS